MQIHNTLKNNINYLFAVYMNLCNYLINLCTQLIKSLIIISTHSGKSKDIYLKTEIYTVNTVI